MLLKQENPLPDDSELDSFFLKFWIYFGFIQPYALKWFWDQKEWIHVEKQGISVLAIIENAEIDGFWASTAKVIHKLWVCGYSSLFGEYPTATIPPKEAHPAKNMHHMQLPLAGKQSIEVEYVELEQFAHRDMDDKPILPHVFPKRKGRYFKGLRGFSTVSTYPTPAANI